ncbi:hypothetical protein KGQ19_24685 [Catenulispora sp. NL8]|uniref:Transcriptional regulator n=1 Tax=Catenulispora pinistramenti TaxID=2705254 RepID=A0ABS5KVK4_9ACTN|nr:hypothetical protein [Catenulispora pinistramenti]MBS2550067.1 hypothetical protein [Catenulispora pinistramenti]
MTNTRPPNQRLRALLAEAGWTGQDLARGVNRAGTEAGRKLSYDRTSVAHWLAGVRPRGPVQALIREVLARRLSRPLSNAEIGFPAGPLAGRPGAGGAQDDLWEVDSVAELTALAGSGADRRRLLSGTGYSLAALVVPRWAQAVGRGTIPVDAQAVAGTEHAETAEALARVFAQGDSAFGGGHGREALARYLASDLAPRLHARMAPRLRRRLFAVAGQLAYLCAFMCFDEELHGEAQRFYRVSLRLATEAGGRRAYAVTLRAMSVQARALGHHQEAIDLAENAAASGTAVAPLSRAFLLGQLAVAHAAGRDTPHALTCLRNAERLVDQATSENGSPLIGAYHLGSLAHQEAAVRSLLGDRAGAVAALQQSLRLRPATERRSRAITSARLAELQLSSGHMEEATATWHRFLDDYPRLVSLRATTALFEMRTRLRPHSGNPAVRPLLERAAVAAAGH